MPDFIDAIDQRIKQKVTDTFSEGVIVSVLPRFVRVKLTGSSRTVTAYYDSGMALEKGKRVFITWSKQQGRYVVMSSFDALGSNAATANRNPADFQLSPPSNVTIKVFPKALGVTWDDPVAQVLAYEIQSNSSATDVGATSELVTRGIFLKPTTTQTYFRVRSITTDFRYSSWSDWVNGTPAAITYASLSDVNLTGLADGDIPIWDNATSKWVPGVPSAAFTGDATDVPYTPTTSGDWPSTPTEVGGALDTLAADVAILSSGSGAPTTAKYIVYDYDGGLSAEKAIPAWEFHSDIAPASPHADDDEFPGSSLDGDWSWVNQGSASAAVAKSRVLLTVPSTTTGNIRGIFRTYPGQSTWETQITGWSSAPFFSGAGSNYYFGMARRDSGSGRIELFVLAWIPNTATMLILCERFTNTTTYNSTVTSISLGRRMAESMYLRLADDNTNVALSWSLDGVNYTALTSFVRAAFLASADQIGLCIFTQQNGGNVYLQSDWMRRTA